MEQYLASIAERYNGLEPEAKMELKAFMETEVSSLIGYLLGPEMSPLISQIQSDEVVVAEVPQQEPMMQEPMPPARPGLGARPQ